MRFLIFAALLIPQLSLAALVDPALQVFHERAQGRVSVLALMDYPRIESAAPVGHSGALFQYLISLSHKSWVAVWPSLQSDMDLGHIQRLSVHPINNSITAIVDAQGLRTLAKTPGISKIYMDRGISYQRPAEVKPGVVHGLEADTQAGKLPYDLIMMGMDKVWAANPNLIGTGVLVGHTLPGLLR